MKATAELGSRAARRISQAPSERWALAGLSLSMLMSALDTGIANAGLPTLAHAFRASFSQVQWIVLSYLLAITALIVGVGRLGDLVGRRRLLFTGISLFTVASILCGLAPSLWVLIAARAAQGLGAAIMMALTTAFVGETVPKEKLGSAMGLLGTMSAIGTAVGPSLGGFLISNVGWPAIFLVNVPIGLLALLLTHRHLPDDQPKTKLGQGPFDVAGTILLALALTAYALAMSTGRDRFGLANLALIVAALFSLGLFSLVEKRIQSPLLKLEMFRNPALFGGLTMSALVSTVIMSTLVVGPFYLSRGLGLDAEHVGLVLSIGPLVVVLAGVPSGRIADRFGTRLTTAIGLGAIATGSLLLSLTSTAFGIPGYIVPIAVVTAGYALFQASNNTAVMSGIDPDQRGVVSGMLSLFRNLGLITGASLMGAIFNFASGSSTISNAVSQSVETGMRLTFAVATGLAVTALTIAWRNAR